MPIDKLTLNTFITWAKDQQSPAKAAEALVAAADEISRSIPDDPEHVVHWKRSSLAAMLRGAAIECERLAARVTTRTALTNKAAIADWLDGIFEELHRAGVAACDVGPKQLSAHLRWTPADVVAAEKLGWGLTFDLYGRPLSLQPELALPLVLAQAGALQAPALKALSIIADGNPHYFSCLQGLVAR